MNYKETEFQFTIKSGMLTHTIKRLNRKSATILRNQLERNGINSQIRIITK